MTDFKYFKLTDFDCQETGENEMDVEFIKALDHLRAACNFPFMITSGFRSAMGMSVGVAKTFVHVDTRKTPAMCWCY
jgi:hypothetical protein